MYINGKACISHQNSVEEDFFIEQAALSSNPLAKAQEPLYKNYISSTLLRRMSHGVKMGATAATISLQKAGAETVDAVITGTGLGCFEDTDVFLRELITNQEQTLSPTAFIQSTHNTIAGQIALIFKCHGYNLTYTQQGHSFENALFDAHLFLKENEQAKVLVGGVDEITDSYGQLFEAEEAFKKNKVALGEGAVFFVLSNTKTVNTKAKVEGISMFLYSKEIEWQKKITDFLKETNTTISEIDVILSGNYKKEDVLNEELEKIAPLANIVSFKKWCGEYFTASSFALWLAALIIEQQKIPQQIKTVSVKKVLVVNQYQYSECSFILISAC
ncbi:MAG: beta-ketoacyl synthase chain length factor [Bacteroidetes bacterium]|nr:beta-ketoacyl synthase chain length factor [Bacteroidota bacterium]